VSTVYVVAPANAYTGGPTALHQLCYTIGTFFHVRCLMAYTNIKKGLDPIHPEYKRYNVPWIPVSKIEDSSENLVIVPETQPHLLHKFKNLKKAIYWLSVDHFLSSVCNHKKMRIAGVSRLVDIAEYALRFGFIDLINYFKFKHKYKADIYYYTILKLFLNIFNENTCLRNMLESLNHADLHIAQSKYAEVFLNRMFHVDNHKILVLREPVEDNYLNVDLNRVIKRKLDVVSFNARKAFSTVYEIVRKIEQRGVKVIPLKNVGKYNMIKILNVSKVFIDIGHHPGRDRPAREAAALGNILLINRSGGYYFHEDMPVPDDYSVHCKSLACKDLGTDFIVDYIIEIVRDYEFHIEKFKYFIEYVRTVEPRLYLKDLERLADILTKL